MYSENQISIISSIYIVSTGNYRNCKYNVMSCIMYIYCIAIYMYDHMAVLHSSFPVYVGELL